MRIVGIDPGLGGAVGLIGTNSGIVKVSDMPIIRVEKRGEVNAPALADLLEEYRPHIVIIESVWPRPGEGVSGAFTFGLGCGAIRGVVGCLGIPMVQITPAAWKKIMGLIGKDKAASIGMAIRLYPALAPMLKRKKDDGRAEAVLIAAAYARRERILPGGPLPLDVEHRSLAGALLV